MIKFLKSNVGYCFLMIFLVSFPPTHGFAEKTITHVKTSSLKDAIQTLDFNNKGNLIAVGKVSGDITFINDQLKRISSLDYFSWHKNKRESSWITDDFYSLLEKGLNWDPDVDSVMDIEFSSTDPTLFSVILSTQTKASLVNASNKKVLQTFQVPCCTEAMAFSPEGVFLAVSAGNKVKMFNTKSSKIQRSLSTKPMKLHGPESLSYSMNGKYLAGGFQNGLIQVFKSRTGQHLVTKSIKGQTNNSRDIDVVDIEFLPTRNPKKRKLITLTSGGEVTFWNTRTWKSESTLVIPPDTAPRTYDPERYTQTFQTSDLEVSPDGNIVVVANQRDLLILSLSQSKLIQHINNAHKNPIQSISFSSSGKNFVSGGENSSEEPNKAVLKAWENPFYEKQPHERKK